MEPLHHPTPRRARLRMPGRTRAIGRALALAWLCGWPVPLPAQAPDSAWVWPSASGNLLYRLDTRGQRIADFSHCGYRGGTEPLPNVSTLIPPERWLRVAPVAGDDLATVQAAVDTVEAMPPDAAGWRGVVFLEAGEYQFGATLTIQAGGVVLKGAGDSSTTGTRLRATAARQYTLVSVGGSGSRSTVSGTTHNLVQKLVPAGARSFEVDSTAGLAAGHTVIVKRPSTSGWIADIDMDRLGPASGGDADDVPWTAGSKDLYFDRVITRIDGNWLTVDAPIPQSIESQYGGGQVWRYTWSGRIRQVGIEDLYGFSDYVSATDESHGWKFVQLNNCQDAWVRNITSQYFGYSAVSVGDGAKWLTVCDSRCLDPVSVIDGGRRYSFNNEGAELSLFVNNYARKGRHDFVFGSLVPGPNAFVHGQADTAYADTGPHHRWSVGGLFDNITVNGDELNVQNRGNMGTGHGWAGAYMAVWNSVAQTFRVRNPPTARNWLVGSVGAIGASTAPVGADPAGTYDSSGTGGQPVHPRSLYYAQLQQRLKWPGSGFREVWVGDIDQHYSTGGTGNGVGCDAAWLAEVQALDATPAAPLFDYLVADRRVAFTFDLALDPGETVVAAALGVGLRGVGGGSDDDLMLLDSVARPRTLASLGWTPLSTTGSSVQTLEVDPALLADGRLNVAFGDDTAVDFAVLLLQVQPAPPATRTLALSPAADAYVRAGAYADTNFGAVATLETKDRTASDVNRESFLRWDLSGVRGTLVEAKVRLAGTAASQTGNESQACLVASDAWQEDTITFNNKPAAGKLFAQWLPVTGQDVGFVVTPQVAETLAGDGLLSLRIASTDNYGAAGNVSYGSRENPDAAKRPQLVLTFVNEAPSIAGPADRSVEEDHATPALPFTVGDDGTAAAELAVSAASSDPALVPADHIVLGGSGAERTVTVVPAAGASGSATITLTVSDGSLTARASFVLTVQAANDPPLAAAGSARTAHRQAVEIDLRALASDEESAPDALFFAVGAASGGSVALLPDGHTARFTPDPGFLGDAAFAYTVVDESKDPRRLLHYRFDLPDSAADSRASDDSGHARDGILSAYGAGTFAYQAEVPFAAAANRSLALGAPDANSCARLACTLAAAEHNLGNADWTVALWFRRAAVDDDDFLFYLGSGDGHSGSGDELQLYCPAGGGQPLALRHWNSANLLDLDLMSGPAVEPGRWHHAALSFACTAPNTGSVRLYLDGSLVGGPATLAWAPKQGSPLAFGGHNSTGTARSRFLRGDLDDVVLLGAALDGAAVARLATRPVAQLGGLEASGQVVVQVTGTPRETWRFAHFGSAADEGRGADEADPDGDGWANAAEHTLGGNPLAADGGGPLAAAGEAQGITLRFTARRAAGAGYEGLARFYAVESTADPAAPGSWAALPGFARIEGLDQAVTIGLPLDGERRFFRLKVTLEAAP